MGLGAFGVGHLSVNGAIRAGCVWGGLFAGRVWGRVIRPGARGRAGGLGRRPLQSGCFGLLARLIVRAAARGGACCSAGRLWRGGLFNWAPVVGRVVLLGAFGGAGCSIGRPWWGGLLCRACLSGAGH